MSAGSTVAGGGDHRPTFVWDDRLGAYDFGPGHPLAPVRVELAVRLCRELGLLAPGVAREVGAPGATDDELGSVHDPAYIAIVRACGSGDGADLPTRRELLAHGLGTADVPVFAGMHEASAHVVGATLTAVRAVWSGDCQHAVNLAGGLHHAMRSAASGFCVYNDPAAAISWALAAGAQRVAYVDVDVHHGDGVERAFWDDPRVLTVSLHESGATLFPGTGWASDVGGPGAAGFAVNVPLPAGTGDEGWLRAFDAVVPPLLGAFRPDLLVTQHGCDSHRLDPLAHLDLTVAGQRAAYAGLHQLAHEYAGGRWVALGGGGYAHVDVVPRAWAHLVGELVHQPVPPDAEVPVRWRQYVAERLGRAAPAHMTDGPAPGLLARAGRQDWFGGPVDTAVQETRRAVFPLHGLDPETKL